MHAFISLKNEMLQHTAEILGTYLDFKARTVLNKCH